VVSRVALAQTVQEVERVTGWTDGADQGHVVRPAAAAVWGLIEGHTRGRGCPPDFTPTTFPMSEEERLAMTPPADLAAVALAATLRLVPNPAQRRSEATTGESGGRRVEGSFEGFTLAEQVVLNRYRRRVR
jgi:hypothetical protein